MPGAPLAELCCRCVTVDRGEKPLLRGVGCNAAEVATKLLLSHFRMPLLGYQRELLSLNLKSFVNLGGRCEKSII